MTDRHSDQASPAEALAQRYHQEQGVDLERARMLAAEVAAQPAVLDAASSWMATGVFPKEPEIRGWSPERLARGGAKPTMIFSLMAGLHTKPEQTEYFIKRELAKVLRGSRQGKPKTV